MGTRPTQETTGRGRAALIEGETEFTRRDAALLRAVASTGSVAKASSELGRSRARALSRIEHLEEAFGELVARRRGGRDGGGSELTDGGAALLDRYDRLQAALTATAQVPETVLSGTIGSVSGELADVETGIGTIRGLHDGLAAGETVQVRIGADAVTVHDPESDPEPDATSARNRRRGRLTGTDTGETVLTLALDVEGTTVRALVTPESADRLGIEERDEFVLSWKATATRLVPASQ
jgi:molybdate transport system regulatory protein